MPEIPEQAQLTDRELKLALLRGQTINAEFLDSTGVPRSIADAASEKTWPIACAAGVAAEKERLHDLDRYFEIATRERDLGINQERAKAAALVEALMAIRQCQLHDIIRIVDKALADYYKEQADG